MDLGVILTAFVVVFPAELPDKTMVASIVLSTRFHHPFWVWVGASTAFVVQVIIAVFFGKLLTALPERPVHLAVAALFAIGAVVLFREGGKIEGEDEATESADGVEGSDAAAPHGPLAVAWRSFVVVFLAEWGDLTQLATASLAARSGEALSVAIGAIVALLSVGAIAVIAGRSILKVLPIATVRRIAAAIFAILAVITLIEAIRG
jgi:putative Ca2+/H+ antiporter (TMEM165/GDT1 family)